MNAWGSPVVFTGRLPVIEMLSTLVKVLHPAMDHIAVSPLGVGVA